MLHISQDPLSINFLIALLILFLSFWIYLVNFLAFFDMNILACHFLYCQEHPLYPTWFLNSSLAAVSQGPVHQTFLFRPGILGPECQQKCTLTNTIKREEELRRGGGKIYKKIIEKVLSRRKLREISKLLPGIPKTATIAHTRIKKESNFASLRGLNSHLRL